MAPITIPTIAPVDNEESDVVVDEGVAIRTDETTNGCGATPNDVPHAFEIESKPIEDAGIFPFSIDCTVDFKEFTEVVDILAGTRSSLVTIVPSSTNLRIMGNSAEIVDSSKIISCNCRREKTELIG